MHVHIFQLHLFPQGTRLSLLGAAPGGCQHSPHPQPAWSPWWHFIPLSIPGLPAVPGKFTTAPPAALPSSATSSATSSIPWAGPATKSGATTGLGAWHVWLFRVCECFGGNTHLSQMLLSTPYVFSCLPSTPHISTTGLQFPCSRSIPSHGLPSWRRVPGNAVLHHLHPHLPTACSQRPQPCFGGRWLAMLSPPGTHPMGLNPGGVAPAPALFCPAPACT